MKITAAKKILIFLFIVLLNGIFANGVTFIDKLTAENDNGNIILRWQTGEEEGLIHFVIQRRNMNGDYINNGIAVIDPDPDKRYEFIDKGAYKINEEMYIYRLKIVEESGVSYSEEVTVLTTPSGVKQTWGSIKALFR